MHHVCQIDHALRLQIQEAALPAVAAWLRVLSSSADEFMPPSAVTPCGLAAMDALRRLAAAPSTASAHTLGLAAQAAHVAAVAYLTPARAAALLELVAPLLARIAAGPALPASLG